MPEPLGRGADFLLRVQAATRWSNAGILDGDMLVVRRQEDARNGDIVVALVGDDEAADEATVKTFYRENGRIRLQPENSALEPIYADHVQVLGKVVGVFRSLHERDRALAPHARPGADRARPRRQPRVPVCGEFVLHARTAARSPARSAARSSPTVSTPWSACPRGRSCLSAELGQGRDKDCPRGHLGLRGQASSSRRATLLEQAG